MLKEIKITDINVGDRHRRDMGDLTTLADSIRQEGLLQPIGVTDRHELVFGERRIRAARMDSPIRRRGGRASGQEETAGVLQTDGLSSNRSDAVLRAVAGPGDTDAEGSDPNGAGMTNEHGAARAGSG